MHKTLYNIFRGWGQVPPAGAHDQRCHTISEVRLDWHQLMVGYHSAASIHTSPIATLGLHPIAQRGA